jgi:hypothetical protein
MSMAVKLQTEKISAMVIILKAKFNTLVKQGEFQQAIGLQTAIEMIEEFYTHELQSYAKETTDRKND